MPEATEYAVWPDGTYCERAQLEELLSWMGDDYRIVTVWEHDDDGNPFFPGGLT